MKIINFISGKDLGGPKQSFVLYSKSLSDMGEEVISVVRKGAAIEPILNEMDLPVHTVTYSRLTQYLFNKSAVKNIQNIMQPLQADVIFVHKQSDFKMVREAVGAAVKIIGVMHSFNFNAKYIEYIDTLVAVSEPVKQYLIANNYKGSVLVIPNMVNVTTNPSYKDMPEIPLIGTMGVFRRNKNFHILIQSLSILKRKNIPFRAVIAGEGRAKLELLYLRWKYNLSNELTIRGWISNNERDKFLDDLDIFVLCSTKETFGMVVIEAMARMKRVIATICGGPEHIITHGKDGYLIESGSAELLANQIIYAIQRNQEADNIPDNALNTIMGHYSTEAVSKSLQSLIRST
jgi:glycosyltransferase involved in cell wall biosynthesis